MKFDRESKNENQELLKKEFEKVLNVLRAGSLDRLEVWRQVGGRLTPSFNIVIELMTKRGLIEEVNDIIYVVGTCSPSAKVKSLCGPKTSKVKPYIGQQLEFFNSEEFFEV